MLTRCGTRPLETERLLLRRFRPDDWQDVLDNWAADPAVQLPYSEPVYATRGEVCGLLEKYITASDDPGYYRWAVIEKASSQCIGQIAFFLVNNTHRFAEIEYCIGRRFQRRGYATEAAREIIRYGFAGIGLHRIQICHKAGNDASRGVILGCGCTYEGTLRDYFFIDGRPVDRLYYSILRPEWEACQQTADASAAGRES